MNYNVRNQFKYCCWLSDIVTARRFSKCGLCCCPVYACLSVHLCVSFYLTLTHSIHMTEDIMKRFGRPGSFIAVVL